jgi:uncharacterized protein (TIGR03435 family)
LNLGSVYQKEIPMKIRSLLVFLASFVFLLSSAAAFGQTASSNPTFEVATVKPALDMDKLRELARAGKMPRLGVHIEGSQARYTYMSLRRLIANAYKVREYQVTGPPWLATERFDIVAKLPEGTTKDDAPKMLQALLTERFKLAAHLDTQERPVLALVVAKDGPKLKESPPDPAPIDDNAPRKPGGMNGQAQNAAGSRTPNTAVRSTTTTRAGMRIITMESSKVTMAGFANILNDFLQMGGEGGWPVVDMTELKGNYQVSAELSLAGASARAQGMNVPPPAGGAWSTSPASEASDPGGVSTLSASLKKLGLRLEPRKAPVEQVVIDHVEKTPTEN